jgi:hypothetical protein
MEKEQDQTSQGLNQIFEIINAKGDEGEIKQILENTTTVQTTVPVTARGHIPPQADSQTTKKPSNEV